MGINLRHINAWLLVAVLSISSFFLLFSPHRSYASELIYTIQTGSFSSETKARAQFDFMIHKLNREKTDYLRIEKIGKFYAVRIGKFEDRVNTERLFHEVEQHFSNALIMKAYIKDERIKRIHRVSLAEDRRDVEEQSSTRLVSEKKEPPPSLKRDLFSSGNTKHNPEGKAEEMVVKNLELNATIIDGQDPLAIIDNEVLGIGESVKGLEVTAVKNNEVILSEGGKQYILRMTGK